MEAASFSETLTNFLPALIYDVTPKKIIFFIIPLIEPQTPHSNKTHEKDVCIFVSGIP
jgi:hypothetical protein